jgi:hypothetical protein
LKKPTANHLPVILKSNTKPASKIFEFFTIICGLWNNLQNQRRLPECRNKHFEEVLSKDLKILSVFIETSKNMNFHFLHNKASKNLKTIKY